MRISASNQLEVLVSQLADSLQNEKCRPEELLGRPNDLVIIQSRGMAKWIDMQVADHNGIATRIEYPFIRTFISSILVKCSYSPKEDIWDRESLAWRIFKLLPEIEKNFLIINDYVKENQLRRFQLAEQLASLIDEYMVYRHDWLQSWSQGKAFTQFNQGLEKDAKHEAWQIALWQKLCESEQNSFQAALQNFLLADDIQPEVLELPPRIAIFGITNMPPVFVNFFEKLSQFTQVTLYHFNPCQEYWGDIRMERFSAFPLQGKDDLGLRGPIFSRTFENEIPDLPHSLLKSLGLLGRDFLNLLIENTSFDTREHYAPSESSQLLHRIQNGILEMQEDFEDDLMTDDSVKISSCHSPRRELEALHDYLVGSLATNPDLRPQDIIVMAPNIHDYAPHIRNIFSNPDNMPLDFSITDQELRGRPLVNSYLKIFELAKSRLSSNDLLEIFENPDFLSCYKLKVDDVHTIRDWIEQARIRWGKDAQQRAEWELPEFEQNSWKFGFDRLLAGYAFDDPELYDSILSCPIGGDGAILGKIKTAADQLFSIYKIITQEEKSLQNWCEYFSFVLKSNFEENADNQNEYNIILTQLQKMSERADLLQMNEVIAAEIAIKSLNSALEEQSSSHGFISRGITFCSLLPMRSIPVKVICMLGLNEGQLPRTNHRSGFDLMNKNWRQGDRTMSLDDRYLFLESLVSAREKLYLSYVGQSERDNEEIPPSVILAEFMEYIKKIAPDFQITHHALNAFNPRYFQEEDTDLVSLSQLHFRAAQSLLKSREPEREVSALFCKQELDLPEEIKSQDGFIDLDLEDLSKFFANSAKTFLRCQLGTSLWKDEVSELPETEAFAQVDALEQFKIKSILIEALIHKDPDLDEESFKIQMQELILADGSLPYGLKGIECFEQVYGDSEKVAEQILLHKGEHKEEQLNFTLTFELSEKIRLNCSLSGIYQQNLLTYHPGKDKFKHLIKHCIKYLALASVDPRKKLHYINQDKAYQIHEIKDARQSLEQILELYLSGLKKPLTFLPNCFQEYHKQRTKKRGPKDHEGAMIDAEKKWAYDSYNNAFADSADNSFQVCFGKEFPYEDASLCFETVFDLVNELGLVEAKL